MYYKYNKQRDKLRKSAKAELLQMNMKFNTANLFGMNYRILNSKSLTNKYKKLLLKVYYQVIEYVRTTHRFD